MDEADFHVDDDIRRAETLPADVYHDPEHYRTQVERIFARSWQLLPDATALKAPGHVKPFTLLPGSLDEPLVLTRDVDHELYCLSNVCTHRGALVVEGEGHCNSLRCRYHGRKFGLDGGFEFMPEFDGAEDFPTEDDDLPSLPVGEWGPFRFTSLDPAFPFEEWIGPVKERTYFLDMDEARFDPDSSKDYYTDANWALYIDNFLEGFHIPYVHARSLSGLDYEGYRTERFAWGNLQVAPGGDDAPAFELPDDHPEAGERISAFYFWLFPNLMLNFYPWGLSMNVVYPLGPRRTKIAFRTWMLAERMPETGIGAHLHRVEMEDEEVVESVQKGVRSRLYDRGRYSPSQEVGTHHFHTLLDRFMNGEVS